MPNVNSKILAKVIEYCQFHVAAEKKVGLGWPGGAAGGAATMLLEECMVLLSATAGCIGVIQSHDWG